MKKKITAILLIAIMSISLFTVMSGCKSGIKGTYGEFTVGDGKNLTVGILSDSQLPGSGNGEDNRWTIHLEKALTIMRDRGVEVLVFAGDFTDLGTKYAWQTFERVYDKVYKDARPIQSFVMGNHDYWLDSFFKSFDIPSKNKMRNRFEKYTDEESLFSHKVVNGYHFIAFSSLDGSYDKSYNDQKWIKEQLDLAVKDDPTKPIFVTTHLNPADTSYGSDDWGNDDIYTLLKDYPQVVSMSGHSHYSILDERSISQGAFTAITTQSLDYVELEAGKENGSIPTDEFGNSAVSGEFPMGMIMKVTDKKVEIERLDVMTGAKQKENWVIDFPVTAENQKYSIEKRASESVAPTFEASAEIKVTQGNNKENVATNFLTFKQASHSDFTHSYRIEFYTQDGNRVSLPTANLKGEVVNETTRDSFLYFSDFYGGIANMKTNLTIGLPLNLPKGILKVKIFATESFGKESEPLIGNITIA